MKLWTKSHNRLSFGLLTLLFAGLCWAETQIGVAIWNGYKGTSIVTRDHASVDECAGSVEPLGPGKYTCRTSIPVFVTEDPEPQPEPEPDPQPDPPPSAGITPHLELEYVNTAGNVTRTVVGSGTVVECDAPCAVSFDASGSRSLSITNLPAAVWDMGYRFSFGEGIGGRWDYPAYADVTKRPLRDEDLGPPITGYVYTVPGKHTAQLRVKDPAGREATLSWTMAIRDTGPGIDITSSAGGWPQWRSFTTYNLVGDLRSFGEIDTGGAVSVVIRTKPGTPRARITTWDIEGRSVKSSAAAVPVKRTTNVRLQNVAVQNVKYSELGFDYGAVVGGEVGSIDVDPSHSYYYNASDIVGEGRLANLRYVRGLFLWDLDGEIREHTNGYPIFAAPIRAFHVRNTAINKTGGNQGAHAFRAISSHSSFRSVLITNSAASSSYVKMYADSVNSTYPEGTAWRDDDRVGHITGPKVRYPYPTYLTFFHQSQMGRAGQVLPTSNVGFGPQSNSAGPAELVELCGYEDIVWYASGDVAKAQAAEVSGRHLGLVNMKKDMGRGEEVQKRTGVHTTRLPESHRGPYIVRSTNTRPVPSPF